MAVFIATLLTFIIAFFALSIGMVFGDIKIKGHCGSPSLEGGCCDAGPNSDTCGTDHQRRCLIDTSGNKIESCSACTCED
ncbi:hypothetical protein KKI24_13520 [bacterium]|nr:hypothetical protein [bacterium]